MTNISSMKTNAADLLFADFSAEYAATRRVLERYPSGKGDWRPHAKSRALAQLATHVADIVNRGSMLLTSDSVDMLARAPLASMDDVSELLAHFEDAVRRFSTVLADATLADLEKGWSLMRGEQVVLQAPKRILMRSMVMSHLVHHRAQLGVYYRLLDIPVPGVYGPSADD